MVIKYGKMVQQKYKEELEYLKSQGKQFTLTFDEWTSTKNRRYLNVNIHIKSDFWNLGLARVKGSLPFEICIKLVEERLQIYGISFHEDIICITTDGAPVMQKIGKILSCRQQLCFAHAVHLAVLDVLYNKTLSLVTACDETYSSCDSDDEEEDDGFQIINDQDAPILVHEFYPLINKVRSVVKIFRQSPTKNDDILQKYVKEEFGKEIQLLIDVKTRWNSWFLMLQRFYLIKNCILKALIDIKSIWIFEEEELSMINNLVTTLEPVNLAVETLCRRDATLLSADTTMSFLLHNLGTNDIAVQLK